MRTFRITNDSRNVILQELLVTKTGDNAGKIVEKNIGYYSSIDMLLRTLNKRMTLEFGLDNLPAALAAETAIKNAIDFKLKNPGSNVLERISVAGNPTTVATEGGGEV